MRADLKHVQHELGITTIYVTHDQVEAMTLADRVALLDKGMLQQLDKPATIKNAPANLYVAGFIGSPPMNFLEGEPIDGRFSSAAGSLGTTSVFRGLSPLSLMSSKVFAVGLVAQTYRPVQTRLKGVPPHSSFYSIGPDF